MNFVLIVPNVLIVLEGVRRDVLSVPNVLNVLPKRPKGRRPKAPQTAKALYPAVPGFFLQFL